MDLLTFVIVILGIALIICFLYFALSGIPVPPAFRAVILIALAVILVLCLAHAAGCSVGMPRPTPR